MRLSASEQTQKIDDGFLRRELCKTRLWRQAVDQYRPTFMAPLRSSFTGSLDQKDDDRETRMTKLATCKYIKRDRLLPHDYTPDSAFLKARRKRTCAISSPGDITVICQRSHLFETRPAMFDVCDRSGHPASVWLRQRDAMALTMRSRFSARPDFSSKASKRLSIGNQSRPEPVISHI